MSAFHLKGLDTLRAIAALSVLFVHIEFFKKNNEINGLWYSIPFFKNTGGHIGVILFFVLSGFLITVLLVKEKRKHDTVSLKSFYIRRILRVWPLYYLVIIISYLLTDFSPSATTLVLCLSIFPNIAHAIGAAWASSPQIWSIGVEEQFYAAWPFVVKNGKRLMLKLVSVFVFFSLLPHAILFTLVRVYPNPEIMELVNKVSYLSGFQCLAAGGIAGLIFSTPQYVSRIKVNKLVGWVVVLTPFGLWFRGYKPSQFGDEMFAILFSVAILLLTTVHQAGLREWRFFRFLGKISYGIYMYHWLILVLIFKLDFIPRGNPMVYNLLLYSITFGSTIAIASFSFNYIEKGFLNLKEQYSRA